MQSIEAKIKEKDWTVIQSQMHDKGFAIVSDILSAEQCITLTQNYSDPSCFRKTVVMERYRFGLGEYKYFQYPLPELIQTIRECVYKQLVPIANAWMNKLAIDVVYPDSLTDLHALCHKNGQQKPTVLILKYGQGGHNTLHQDLYGDIFFPIQIVLFLSEPDMDFTGGEFVLVQQTPRAQSKAIVLKPHKGDMLIFTTSFRPVKGSKGYYRAAMKHGVSEVHSGERYTLGIIFHDALN